MGRPEAMASKSLSGEVKRRAVVESPQRTLDPEGTLEGACMSINEFQRTRHG